MGGRYRNNDYNYDYDYDGQGMGRMGRRLDAHMEATEEISLIIGNLPEHSRCLWSLHCYC